ncbi:hypothetical protein B0I37DRAFT_362240 [Chaetomium sp. MPI-CAGE-AT-0009]|nr:hypothetical protein B0I37DRAFT_362240 [Chaetomium sp. MPI-CAGE-AT-0009]
MHRGDIESIDQWNETPPGTIWASTRTRPTIFNHHGYLDHDVYPNGIADVVGYWAEDRIFGGVTVFDRGSEERAPRFPPNVYFHSCRAKATCRYYQLTDAQQGALTDFLLADHPDPSSSPLPILADRQNVVRLNDELAILKHFYRDIWERKPPTREYLRQLIGKPRSVTD